PDAVALLLGLHLGLGVPVERPRHGDAELLEVVGEVAPSAVGVAAAEQDHGPRTITTPTTMRALMRTVATATPGVRGFGGWPARATAASAPKASQAARAQSHQVMADTPSGGTGWCGGSGAFGPAASGSCSAGSASA